MKPKPKKASELVYPELDFETDMETLVSYITAKWDGVEGLKPKGYDEFCEDYQDFKGIDDDEQTKKDIDDFEGFNDSTAVSFPFPTRINLAHTAYDDHCQGRPPIMTLVGAIAAHGHASGILYGKDKELRRIAAHLSYIITCKLRPKSGKLTKSAEEAVDKLTYGIQKVLNEMVKGEHDFGCECELCKIVPLNSEDRKEVRKKIKKALNSKES